jgi:hypothetical protein
MNQRDRLMNPEGLLLMEQELSRRSFFGTFAKGLVVASALSRVAPEAKAAIPMPPPDTVTALAVFSAIGNITVPVDQDPGWATFEPGISQYGLNTVVYQVFLGNNIIAFDAYEDCLVYMDSTPPKLGYNTNFLNMGIDQQNQYLTDILAGNFDTDGWQAILSLAVNASVVAAKTLFYSNYPNHLAVPGAEFQNPFASGLVTGWVQMGLKGPISQAEETALRAKYTGIQELPGIDPSNPYI